MNSSSNFDPAASAPFNNAKLHLYHYSNNNNRNVVLKNIGALSGNDVIFSGGGGNNRNASDNHLNLDNVAKSRVPDILMINKYYGLIPQKFTINTRKPPPASPSSAKGGGRSGRSTPNSSSKRAAKPSSGSGSNKPRAKSCSSSHNSRKSGDMGHSRSDCDSPDELIKMRQLATGVGHGPRKQQSCPSSASTNEKSNFDKSSLDPFGLVTKKMSVEKYKKWRNAGVGAKDHPRSLDLEKDLSIGQTLSLTAATAEDNEFPSSNNMNSHAKSVASAHRRVIKIDLNRVSWDEENYQAIDTARSEEEKIVASAKNGRNAIIDDNDSGHKSVSTTKEDNDANENQPSASKGKINGGENILSSNDFSSISTTSLSSPDNPLDLMNDSSNFIGKQPEAMSENVNGKKKLLLCKNKALSFEGDGSSSSNGSSESGAGLGVKNCLQSANKKESKRRPVTASANRVGSSSCGGSTFSTPNSFNPPSKVIPWTQQKTAGGKPLTLAERRAKLQRAPSIHSSASSSMEYGTGWEDEDGQSQRSAVEDTETINFHPFSAQHQNQHLPSSALRDTRKPLYVMQPPEVPTMIGQINPNADEDIQIEIEKVAIMLKKMQNKHNNFSLSLDSGIEAEVMGQSQLQGPSSTSPSQQQPLKSAQSTGSVFSKTENSVSYSEKDQKSERPLLMEATGSLSSASSTDSSSAEEDKDNHKKLSLINTKTKPSNTPGSTSDKLPKTINKENANQLKSNGEKMNPSQSQTGAGTTSTLQRRPPLLKKAVSISCEHELSKTGGRGSQNEVNLKNANNTNDNGKRPKTATTAGENQRSLLQQGAGAGTRSTRNYHHHQRPSLSSENHSSANLAGGASGNGSGASQGSRNRKILIKKALMEINQAGGNLRRKWSTLGRPRTAPTSDKNNAKGQGNVSQAQSHQRKPLKASPFPISGLVKGAPSLSGKSPSPGSGACQSTLNRANQSAEYSSVSEGVKCDKSDSKDPTDSSTKPPKQSAASSKRRSMFRQCFSLDETQLLGFSMRSVHEGRFPVFETSPENSTSGEVLSSSSSSLMLNDEISFLSSEKREQCLKVYEKMKQTGCTVKLETILRGMLTPSEYRAFMREAEKATQEESRATEKAKRDEEEEEDEAAGNGTKKSVETPTEEK